MRETEYANGFSVVFDEKKEELYLSFIRSVPSIAFDESGMRVDRMEQEGVFRIVMTTQLMRQLSDALRGACESIGNNE